MADRTVRAIFEAKVDTAQRSIRGLATGVDDADKKITGLQRVLDKLGKSKVAPKVDVEIAAAEKDVRDLTARLEALQKLDATPEVRADVAKAQSDLAAAETSLKALQGQKAEIVVTADVDDIDGALDGVVGAAASAGDDGGRALGDNLIKTLVAIPIAGAVIGLGAAIAGGIWQGIQEGLAIEAGRDMFSARTGLDEATASRFGRAAGEAYADAWGTSIEENLETARVALEQGLIDPTATQADIEAVISQLSGVTDIMQADIPAAARAAGQMIRTGLAANASEAFDVLIAGYQNGADASNDLLDTLEEYPTHFRDLGLSGQEAVGLLAQGLEGGAFNADKVADALKELTIRVKDLSATGALTELGLDAQKMADAFAAGGPAAHDALGQILAGLNGVIDPSERARLAVGLFGTQAEDMAGALGSLDLSTAVDSIGGVEGAAGAAADALATLSDNAAAEMESAKRNIELAGDGIKGALAAAFGDEIEGFATYIQAHRAEVMSFLGGLVEGALSVGRGFVTFSASAVDGIGQVIALIGDLVLGMDAALPGDQHGQAFQEWAYGIRDSTSEAADTMRTDWVGAIDDVEAEFQSWLGPELMSAKLHDATVAMTADMEAFNMFVDQSGGTVEINGESQTAEDVLGLLVESINASDGTVTINGERVPAESALQSVIQAINAGSGTVSIGAWDNTGATLSRALAGVNSSSGTINIYAADYATTEARRIAAAISTTSASIKIYGQRMLHDGGTVPGPGGGPRASGWVPGPRASYDNVQWPTTLRGDYALPGRASGGFLTQPLSGGEYVVNAASAAANAGLLQAINASRGTLAPVSAEGATIDGARITGTLAIGGDGLARIIDGRIRLDHEATASAGRRA